MIQLTYRKESRPASENTCRFYRGNSFLKTQILCENLKKYKRRSKQQNIQKTIRNSEETV